jgi:hypothetical protein
MKYLIGFNPQIMEFYTQFDYNGRPPFDPFEHGFKIGFGIVGSSSLNE